MRVLTEKEKELLTGGAVTLDTITVTACYFDYDFGYNFDLWNDPWDYTYYDNSSGGGSGGDPVYDCNTSDPTAAETYTDAKAAELARAIIAQANHRSVEYLGFIYRDEHGVLRSSQLFGGTGDHVSVNFEALGFPVSQIVGVVHNHDDYHYGQNYQSEQINRMPSQGDWNTADALVAAGADPNVLSFYLLDTADSFREFNYVDKSRWASSGNVVRTSASPGATISKTAVPSSCPM